MSQIATADYVGWLLVYSQPIRVGGYDTMFDDLDNLPPFTPRIITINALGWQEGLIEGD